MAAHNTADLTFGNNQRNGIMLSPEELKVLEECRSEGFNNRGVPSSIAFAACTFYALKKGLIKSHPKYGVMPAVGIAGMIGCFAGILSYKSICVERVLAVPNGTLRQQLEAMRIQSPTRPLDLVPKKFEVDVQHPMASGSQMDFYQSNNNFDGFTGVNTDGNQLSNYDTVKPLPTYSPGIHTYDELRQRNRDEYMENRSRQYIPPQRSAPPQGQGNAPTTGPSGPIFEDTRPFDRDRVPQYHLD